MKSTVISVDWEEFAELPRVDRVDILGLLREGFPDCHWLRGPVILSSLCLRELLSSHDGMLAILFLEGHVAAAAVLRDAEPHPRGLRYLLRVVSLVGLALNPWRAFSSLRRKIGTQLSARSEERAQADDPSPAFQLWIELVAVSPSLRSRGLGKILLDHLVEAMAKSQASAVGLCVRAGNVGARQFWEREGFKFRGPSSSMSCGVRELVIRRDV